MVSDGRIRTYLLHLPPAYVSQTSLPLVIVLHGGGGNAGGIVTTTGMSLKADEESFIAVYPNGTGRLADHLLTWNACNCCGYAMDEDIDDVGFIKSLVTELQTKLSIDLKRVYVTGISNGAMMAYRLACELPEMVAAIAPVAGALNCEDCQPSEPMSAIIFHGTADEHVPYDGGVGSKSLEARVDKPVSYAVSFWVEQNGCSPVPHVGEFGSIRRETYSGGAKGAEVTLYTIKGGGHAWPGGKAAWRGGDAPTQEISATDLMWEFFARHPKE